MKNFTEREMDVLYLLVKGLNNNKIAEKLCISKHTVKAHLISIYSKLDVCNRVQASLKAIEEGIIGLENIARNEEANTAL